MMKVSPFKVPESTVSPQVNIPPAMSRKTRPSQRRRASAGPGMAPDYHRPFTDPKLKGANRNTPYNRLPVEFRIADWRRRTDIRLAFAVRESARNRKFATHAMQITKQLAIFLENKPGTLARVCDALAEAKINIYAITVSDTIDHSVIRLVVNDPRRALL